MKIQKEEINKKEFWLLFLILSFFSFFIYFFGRSFSYYSSIQIVTENNAGDFSNYLFMNFPSLLITIILSSIPVYFFVKRILSKNPKRLWFKEFPLLVLIYSFFSCGNLFFGLMIAGPIRLGLSILKILFFNFVFVFSWMVLLSGISFLFRKFFSKINSE
jgi:hypothetical protein